MVDHPGIDGTSDLPLDLRTSLHEAWLVAVIRPAINLEHVAVLQAETQSLLGIPVNTQHQHVDLATVDTAVAQV
ncbi:hypothetical protein D3C86_2239560 [compost metagenome]